jgi:LysM repeat protein
MTATLYPAQFGEFEVRLGLGRPAHSVYMRRRLAVALLLAAAVVVLGLSANTVLANRGGVPASTSTVRPANVAVAPGASPVAMPAAVGSTAVTYIVQPGDSIWQLAAQFHGTHGFNNYVDSLIAANGGTVLQPGQILVLP